MASGVGCHIGDVCFNVLAYADDLVLLAPSWAAMQQLLNVFHSSIHDIDMTCNVTKTVCMVFNPLCRHKLVANSFPLLKLGSSYIHFVDCFKYLGHIITDNARDDDDIKREVRNLFVRTNVLIRKFHLCFRVVKITLFKSYCSCMYDVGLWSVYNCGTLSVLKSAYHKCIKLFFGFARHFSVTQTLLELGYT